MIPKHLTTSLDHRLRSLQGHISSLLTLIHSDTNFKNTLHQFQAVKQALAQAENELKEEVRRKYLALKLVEAKDHCDGSCQYAKKIDTTHQQFPKLSSEDIPSTLEEILVIAEYLEQRSLDRPPVASVKSQQD